MMDLQAAEKIAAYRELSTRQLFTSFCFVCGWQLADDKSNFGDHDNGCEGVPLPDTCPDDTHGSFIHHITCPHPSHENGKSTKALAHASR